MFFGWFFTLAVISVIPAWIAQTKGRSFWGWWIYALFLWPITLIHSFVIRADTKELEKRQIQSGNKKCPACAEIIKAEAKLCKHCGTEQEITEEPDTTVIGADGVWRRRCSRPDECAHRCAYIRAARPRRHTGYLPLRAQ